MGKTTELMQLLKTGNSDAARKLIAKMKKSGKKKQLTKELIVPDESAHGQTVMHYCAALNFVEFIHELADLGAPIDSLDERGFTPLHLAAGSGRTSAVQALLGKGGDPNVASHNGDTPLHLACSGGHTSTVEALIASQANATGFNVSGHTPLDLASEHGHANAVTMLLRSGQFSQSYLQRSDIPHTALILAAKSGHNEVIGILVKHGFDVNRKLPGANGNSFHEAALYGKVETVKYLLLLGADVQAVNHQGLTALDIVNMYTDPRSAGLMKQVLQDALAQLARVRISQQAQPSHPHQGHTAHQPSQGHAAHQGHTAHQPPQGHAPHQGHTAHSGYPAHAQQRPLSQETHYQQPNPHPQQPQATHQPPTGPSPTPAGPVGFSYIMPGMIKPRTKSEPVVEPHANPSPQLSHAHQQQHGQTGHHSQSQAHAAYSQERSQSIQPQPQPHSNSSYGQPRSHAGHSGMTQRSQSIQVQPSYEQQRAAQQLQQQQQQQYNQGQYSQQQQPQYAQPQPQSQHQQQQYSQQQQQQYNQQQQQAQGTPGVAHHDVGGATPPMDLASQIQAKLAARKPMTTSPTQKDFPTGGDEPFRRSNTMSSQTSMGEIRQAVLRRRGSMTDRSSSSPDREGYDRSNPPTLPRRGPAGPPAFTPVPPIQTATLDRPRRKPTPKPLPPPEPEAENELLKKLMRRQNRIQKAEEEGVESLEPKIDEPIDSEPPKPAAVVGPPPIPERKTPVLSSEAKELSPPPPPPQTPPPSSHVSPPSQAPPPSQPPAEEPKIIDLPKVKSKPRAKPPPTKPKKEEPEVPPWQLELQKKKEKRASESIELAKSMMVETDEQKEVPLAKEVSPSHFPIPPSPVKMLTPPPEPAPPPPSQQPPSLQPVLPPPAENQYEIPPPRVATKKKPSPTARRKIESKPPIPPPTEEPRPPPAELLPPPPTASLPPAVMPPPPSMASLPPAGMPPPPPTASLPPAGMPQTLPLSTTQTVSQSGQPGTPSSEMSRSTSLSSIPATGSLLQISDPIPIGDWLSSYKLAAYLPVFEEAGYDTTDFLTGITTDELTEIGVSKPGHRKKLMTALSTVHHKEHLLLEKPASVRVWLTSIGLVQYEEVLVEAGYDDIDFISDISGDELQDIGITKNGHLKRFMRGIAELVEVSKSAPPTPSPIPRLQHVNGLATPPTGGTIATFPEDNKTPEPQDDDVTIIAPPVGFDEADLMNQIANNLQPPVAVKSKRFSQDEAVLTSDPSRARAYSGEREGSVPSDGGGGYNRMRQLLEQQMGSSRSTESLEMSVGSESSDVVKNNSRSPSHSPRVARKPKAPPPAPKRSSQTQLSLASLSSSTSSLSSTSDRHDKRASADVGLLMESPPKVPQKTRRSTVEVSQVHVGDGGVDMTDSGGNHSSMAAMKNSFSVEDITAALDDMVSGDEFLADDLPPVRNVPREPVRSESVRSEGAGGNATSSIKNMVSADRELDVLSRVLQGFDASADDNDSGEADQLLADIDDMLADLNSHLDFITPDDDGTDV